MPFNYDKYADFRYTEDVSKIFKNCYCFGAAFTATAGGAMLTGGAAVSANLALASTLVSVVGAVSQGQSQAANARFQGQVAGQNAELARRNQVRSQQQAVIDEEDFRRDSAASIARRFAAGGATGQLLDRGSFASTQGQAAGEDELTALRLRNQFAVRTGDFGLEAQNETAQGQLFGAQAKQAGTSSLFNAGSSLFSGASSISSKIPSSSPKKTSTLKSKYPSIKF